MHRRLPLAFLVALAACKDSTATSFAYPPPCTGSVPVTMTTVSGKPAFAWTPNCGMTALVVTREPAPPGGEPPVWAFDVPMNEPFGPVVPYGTAPRRANVYAGPASLTLGTKYRVTVEYVVGGDVLSAHGSTTFTWYPPD
ncbi:MAG TPA: hypothetical protein VHM30_16475 [Gemmatimonadaceae bacterium]|nr:hypothetical protein [Gemmatimonadaceae bacterium]